MRHDIIEKKVEPELWTNPVPVNPDEIPVLGKEDYEAGWPGSGQCPRQRDMTQS